MALSSRKGQPSKGSTYVEVPSNEPVDDALAGVETAGLEEQTTKKWTPLQQDSLGRLQNDGLTPADFQQDRAKGKAKSSFQIEMGTPDDDGSSASAAEFVRHWKNSPYAVSCVPSTWTDEVHARRNALVNTPHPNICVHACRSQEGGESMCCCLILSGVMCGKHWFNAKRIGNMVVLKEEQLPEDSDDEEEASETKNANSMPHPRRSKLIWVLGPYWPFLCMVTYPLVLVVSTMTLFLAIPKQHPAIVLCWVLGTALLLYNLFNVSCRDPGIMLRHPQPPHGQDSARWRWNDDTLSYRPRGAVFDPDCGCIIEEYDHVCPWTGTAIGKKNMRAFQGFVGMIFVCMIMDILLLTGALGPY